MAQALMGQNLPGQNLPGEQMPGQGRRFTDVAPGATVAGTKFCMDCGKTMPERAKFCPECGSAQ